MPLMMNNWIIIKPKTSKRMQCKHKPHTCLLACHFFRTISSSFRSFAIRSILDVRLSREMWWNSNHFVCEPFEFLKNHQLLLHMWSEQQFWKASHFKSHFSQIQWEMKCRLNDKHLLCLFSFFLSRSNLIASYKFQNVAKQLILYTYSITFCLFTGVE